MTAVLHGEYTGTVEKLRPWATLVHLEDGTEVLVYRIKAAGALVQTGDAVTVVVLDDSRVPVRGSLLLVDREIARDFAVLGITFSRGDAAVAARREYETNHESADHVLGTAPTPPPQRSRRRRKGRVPRDDRPAARRS
ncbi:MULTISPECIES: hypothetical protein [Cellulomonas]|uniref:hypothetical protein n=1 Tax=Cellulomonas TaxID=1707 RepID=UPI0010A861D6|nr:MULTISPECIES: hypothetical protein [Cellulomonas]